MPTTRTLLARVAWRMYTGTLLRRLGWALVIGLAIGIAALVTVRLTGFLSAEQSRWLLAAGPLGTMALALAITRRPQPDAAARLVDEEAHTGDLFLTSVSLDKQPDSYEPLVAARAEEQAAALKAEGLVDPWSRLPLRWMALLLLAAVITSMFVPTLDPFGTVAQAEEVEAMAEQLKTDAEEVALRKAELQRELEETPEGELTPEVQAALDELDRSMAAMRPERKQQNKLDVRAAGQQMGKLWERASDRLTKELMDRQATNQRFGGEAAQRHREWKEQLQRGETDGIRSELEQIKQLLEEAAQQQKEAEQQPEGSEAAKDAEAKRDEAMRQAEKKMADLKEFAEQEIGSQEMAQALERALRQMDAAQKNELAEQALEQMRQAGELTEMEAEALAQAARDMEAIQEALETLQQMREMQARNDGEFDASECEDCQTAADYREFYEQQLADADGQGGRGERDESTPVEVAEDVSAGFKKEVAESFLKKGEMLMSLAGKGDGTMDEDEEREFKAVRRALSQEAAEAIEREDIPPGYQDGIKAYFRTLEAEDDAGN